MFSSIANIFGYLLKWLYNLVGQNYGFAILLFTVFLRIILLPITIKQQQSMKKTTELQGKMQELQFKYKNDQEQLNKEIMNLYKQEKVSPFSGCVSIILQFVIIFSVFKLVSQPLTYMNHVSPGVIESYKAEIIEEDGKISNYHEIEIIQKKASIDDSVKINMNFLGLDLSKVPNQDMSNFKVYIIPILYIISSVLSIKLTTGKKKSSQNNANDMTDQMNKMMPYMMPIVAVSIVFVAPLGLALYWFISNTLMIVEKLIIDRFSDRKNNAPKLIEGEK